MREGNEAKDIRVQGGETSLWVKRGICLGWKGLRGLGVADGLFQSLFKPDFGDVAGRPHADPLLK